MSASCTRATRRALLLLAATIFFGATFGMAPVVAHSDPDPGQPSFDQGAGGNQPRSHRDPVEIAEAYEAQRRQEQEREKELQEPRFVAERAESRHEYADATPAQAEHLLTSKFGPYLRELNGDPARFLSDAKLNRSYGDGAATVTSDGKTELMEGPTPLVVENDEGKVEKVDLSLEQTAEGYEPENPIIEIVIGDIAGEGVDLGDEGLAVTQLGAGDVAGREFGDKNIFYGEIGGGNDTDLLVSPTAGGVELSDLLRSVESPETLRFQLDLPAGATVEEVPGDFALIKDSSSEILGEVRKPTAVDAQGTRVPVELEVEGDTIVLRVEHRQADLAYPILVDPEIVYEFWDEWYKWNHLQGLNYWQWYTNFGGFTHRTDNAHWPSQRGLFIGAPNESYWANLVGEWYLFKNKDTYLKEAAISPFARWDQECSSDPQPYDFDGFYDAVVGQWNEIHTDDAINNGNSWLPGWGHELGFGLATDNAFKLNCWRDLMVGGVNLRMGDWAAPTLTQVSGMPSGWVKMDNTPRTISVSAGDSGLGVQSVRLFGIGGREYRWNRPLCAGTFEDPCPNWDSGTITYELSGSSVYEGPQQMTVQALDPVNHGTNSQQFFMQLDGLPPKVHILPSQLANITEGEGAERLSFPVYNLKLKAEDGTEAEPRSGVKSIKLYIDGKPFQTLPNGCTSTVCPRSLEGTFPIKLTGLSGGTHTLEIAAADFVDNETDPKLWQIKFKYFPATGMDEDYVLQHFALPDGHNYAEEPNYRGPELAVNVMNGNLVYRERDLKVDAPTGPLSLERIYNSQQPAELDGQWGHGWTLEATPELRAEDAEEGSPSGGAAVQSGVITRAVPIPDEVGETTFSPYLHSRIRKTSSNGYEVVSLKQPEVSVFDSSGRVEEVRREEETGPPQIAATPASVSAPEYSGAFSGSEGPEGEFSEPMGAAVDGSGDLWVTDSEGSEVERFNAQGEFEAKFGSTGSGQGQLSHPTALAIASNGNLVVADTGNSRVEVFNSGGTYVRSFGSTGSGSGQFGPAGPAGVAVGQGGKVFASDPSGGRIEVFTEAGQFVQAIGSGVLEEPIGIAVRPAGKVWVVDAAADKVLQFNEAGELVRQFGFEGSGEGQLRDPGAIAVDSKGEVWVADRGNGRILGFDQSGNQIAEFGSQGNGAAQFAEPAAIATDADGNLWVADALGEKEPPPAAEPREGLVAAYSFDQGSGATATDSSGHGHDATITGADWTTGKFGSALEFDAESEDLLTVTGTEDLQLEDFTLEAWVNPAEARNFAPVISKWGPEEPGYALYAGGGTEGHPEGLVTFHEWVEAYVYGPDALPLDQWSHIALTNDGSKLRLYVNGVLLDERESVESKAGEGPLKIGGNPDAPWDEFFDGKLDEVRIYNRALSEGEVKGDQQTPTFDSQGHDRIEKWSIPGYSPDAFASPDPATVDFAYSSGKLSGMSLDEPLTTNEPAMAVSTSGGLTSSVNAGAAGTATYSYQAGQLKSATDPQGETQFEKDAENRITQVTLPNGTSAAVKYDEFGRVIAVTVKGAGEEEKKTQFFYRDEPRETKVWGGGNPEITYAISEAGEVLSWEYAENPPKIVGIKGSLWGHRNNTQAFDSESQKDQTLFATAESPHGIASVKIVTNGRTVVAEAICKDESTPPAHNCDQPEEPAEWIVYPADLTPGRLDIEIVATDSLGHSSAERFFVTVPQQPPPSPDARERPNFNFVKKFREEYGLDREHPLTTAQMNRLILELLYEWETQLPVAMASTAEFGIPMRQPELLEMERRREVVNQASAAIPRWAEEHAVQTYGGFYVDNRAGGLIYVGFTENQASAVNSLKESGTLIEPTRVREFPSPPTRSVLNLEAGEPAVIQALESNEAIMNTLSSVAVAPGGSSIQIGSTEPEALRAFIAAQSSVSVPVTVVFQPAMHLLASRYAQSGPIVAGAALWGQKGSPGDYADCTAGYGAKALSGRLRGALLFEYFTVTAGHCYAHGGEVGIRKGPQPTSGHSIIGKVKRGPFRSTKRIVDGEAVGINEARRSHSVLNGEPYLEAQPIQGGQKLGRERREVCWSGATGGKHCGTIYARGWTSAGSGHTQYVYVVAGPTCEGDSGGPVWDPETHRAVGIIVGGQGAEEIVLGKGVCFSKMGLASLEPVNSGEHGILAELEVLLLQQE